MARNEEKHFGRLNRLFLQQEKDEYLKKHPRRPKLDTLNTVEEIQEWLPSIKQDMDFYLKQCQVPCYPEHKIAEFQNRVLRLEKEYKSFVRKTRQLSPGLMVTPWTNRPYQSKKKDNSDDSFPKPEKQNFTRIQTPLIDAPVVPSNDVDIAIDLSTVNKEMLDKPLQFSSSSVVPVRACGVSCQLSEPCKTCTVNIVSDCSNISEFNTSLKFRRQEVNSKQKGILDRSETDVLSTSVTPQSLLDLDPNHLHQNSFDFPHNNKLHNSKSLSIACQQKLLQEPSAENSSKSKHLLGLDYSSSESDQDS